MKNKLLNLLETKHKLVLLTLLGFNLFIKLIFFYNSTATIVSEAGSNYGLLQAIENGEKPAFYTGTYRSILAYIGYFFKKITGTLDTFFWFQALISVLSVYILYLICLKLTGKKIPAFFAVLLATILMDYHLLTPVFYYQIFEIFFTLLVVYLTMLIIEKKKIIRSAAILIIPCTIYFSVFFRGTLNYFWFVFLLISVFTFVLKNFELSGRLAAIGIITLILFIAIPHSKFRDIERPAVNDIIFFGHTLYGGDGGEGSFVYEKNRSLYESRLKEYMIKNNLDSVTVKIHNDFQISEIKDFITKNPHRWFLLQVRKITCTFGIIPIRDNLELLTTGNLPIKWYLSALIIQIPYIIILLIFITLTILFFRIKDFEKTEVFFMFLVLLYLITAVCFYGTYAERYRTVVIMAGLIPASAFYFNRFIDSFPLKSPKRLRYILLIITVIALFSHWGYQAYDALVLNKERYFDALKTF